MRLLGIETALILALFSGGSAYENFTAAEPAEPLAPAVYPPEAALVEFEGECRVVVLISGSGVVKEAWVAQSSGREDADRAALDAARATRWHPATLGGVPVSSRLSIPYKFELGDPLGQALEPAAAEPSPLTEETEPLLELEPSEPILLDYTPPEPFAVVGLEVDELGLALKAWLVRSSGQQAADAALLEACYSTLWAVSTDEPIRGQYLHEFGGVTAMPGQKVEPEPSEEAVLAEEGGAGEFDQLKIGKYGQRQ